MSQFKKGDRVEHHTTKEAFGAGTVVEDESSTTGAVLVRWDKHRVTRESGNLAADESHVSASSLKLILG